MFREARAVAFSSLFSAVATVSGRLCVVAVKSGFQFVWRLSEAQPTRGPIKKAVFADISVEMTKDRRVWHWFVSVRISSGAKWRHGWWGTYHIHIGSDDDTPSQSWGHQQSQQKASDFDVRPVQPHSHKTERIYRKYATGENKRDEPLYFAIPTTTPSRQRGTSSCWNVKHVQHVARPSSSSTKFIQFERSITSRRRRQLNLQQRALFPSVNVVMKR